MPRTRSTCGDASGQATTAARATLLGTRYSAETGPHGARRPGRESVLPAVRPPMLELRLSRDTLATRVEKCWTCRKKRFEAGLISDYEVRQAEG